MWSPCSVVSILCLAAISNLRFVNACNSEVHLIRFPTKNYWKFVKCVKKGSEAAIGIKLQQLFIPTHLKKCASGDSCENHLVDSKNVLASRVLNFTSFSKGRGGGICGQLRMKFVAQTSRGPKCKEKPFLSKKNEGKQKKIPLTTSIPIWGCICGPPA